MTGHGVLNKLIGLPTPAQTCRRMHPSRIPVITNSLALFVGRGSLIPDASDMSRNFECGAGKSGGVLTHSHVVPSEQMQVNNVGSAKV